MLKKIPFVSVIIPCRNEEKYIAKCLDSILNQNYPKDKMEILIIDGVSEDKTKKIVENYCKKFSFIKILENPEKFTPFGLNIGIKVAKGEIIVRMDAHAEYEKDYILKCVECLIKYKVDNVGGVMITLSRNNTVLGRAIASVLSHRFGVGNAVFRTGADESVLVDTVFGGCYKKEVFEKIGYFNEKLSRGQDMDFNLRLKKSGGKILLVPEIKSYYYARSDFKSFWDHSFMDGVELVSPLMFGIVIFSWRHVIPLIFVSSLIVLEFLALFSFKFLLLFLSLLSFYLLINIYFSAKISLEKRDLRYLFVLPFVFIILHVGYGLGSVFGLLKVFSSKNFWKNLKNKLIRSNIKNK